MTLLTNLNSLFSFLQLLHLNKNKYLDCWKYFTLVTFLTNLNRLLPVELIIHLLHLIENNSVQVLEKSYTYCSYSCSIKKIH
jgi:hypothetical protein